MTNELLKIVPTLQSVALAENALRLVRKKKKRAKDFISTGVTSIVGAAIIAEERKFLSGF
jgi:hypothetical protein